MIFTAYSDKDLWNTRIEAANSALKIFRENTGITLPRAHLSEIAHSGTACGASTNWGGHA